MKTILLFPFLLVAFIFMTLYAFLPDNTTEPIKFQL